MKKQTALDLLGGRHEAAKEIGITVQAVDGWPDELSAKIRDRVQAALYRKQAAAAFASLSKRKGAAHASQN